MKRKMGFSILRRAQRHDGAAMMRVREIILIRGHGLRAGGVGV